MQPNYSYSYFCCYNGNLKKVACIRLDENSIVSNMLYSCEKLEDVTIEGTIGQSGIDLKWSTKLSRASIESFINALSETASGQRITFSITAVKNAFGGGAWDSDGDGKDDTIMGSVEWIDLMNSKSNWTITLA